MIGGDYCKNVNCVNPLPPPVRAGGRPRRFCSDRCRVSHWQHGRGTRAGHRCGVSRLGYRKVVNRTAGK